MYRNEDFTAGGTWASIHDGAGTATDPTGGFMNASLFGSATSNKWFQIRRGMLSFDTSALTAGANVTAGSVDLWGFDHADPAALNPSYGLFSATPAAASTLANSDYGQCGTTAYVTARADGSWAFAAYNNFTLLAAGVSAISKTGTTSMCFRSTYDASNTEPVGAWFSGAFAYKMVIKSADTASNTNDPKLSIAYTPAVTTAVYLGMFAL